MSVVYIFKRLICLHLQYMNRHDLHERYTWIIAQEEESWCSEQGSFQQHHVNGISFLELSIFHTFHRLQPPCSHTKTIHLPLLTPSKVSLLTASFGLVLPLTSLLTTTTVPPLGQIAITSVALSTAVGSTALLNYCVSPYVHRLVEREGGYEAVTVDFFARKINTEFKVREKQCFITVSDWKVSQVKLYVINPLHSAWWNNIVVISLPSFL